MKKVTKKSPAEVLRELKKAPITQDALLDLLSGEKPDKVLAVVEQLLASDMTDCAQKLSAARLLLEHKAQRERQEIHITIL